MKELPMVCICAMSMSMLEALVMLPAHLGHVSPLGLSRHRANGNESAATSSDSSTPATIANPFRRIWNGFFNLKDRFFNSLVDVWYDRLIRLLLHWRYVTLAGTVATLSIAIGLVEGGIVPFTPVPKMDSETVVCALKMPVGTPAAQTRDRLIAINDILTAMPEVVNVQVMVGIQVDIAGEGSVGESLGSHLGQLIIELKPAHERNRTSETVVTDLRHKTEKLSGVNSITWSALSGGPAGRALEVKVTSDREESSVAAAKALREKIASYDGVFDLDDDLNANQREVRLKLREAARPTGITVTMLGNEVRNAFYGREARRLTRNREDVKIMVRYPKEFRQNVYNLESMYVPCAALNGRHHWVPVREVAELTEDQSHDTLHRSEQRRAISVFADVDELHNDNEIANSLQKWIDTEFRERFPDVRVEMLGKTLENRKFINSMMVAFPVSILIIYVLLAALFRSYVQPLVVLIAIPFGVQGAIVGHWIMGYNLTIMSLIGLVALNGIVDNDSLVLVDFINTKVKAGLSHFEASVEGSKLRMRAIVLNTITAVVGMTPLMFETSFQAKFLIPLAVTLTWGLIFATALTLVVVPAINMVFFDVAWLFGKAKDEH
jgi:multidrug efflux pump subunit AcrB